MPSPSLKLTTFSFSLTLVSIVTVVTKDFIKKMKVLSFLAYLAAKTSHDPVTDFFSRRKERFQCHDVSHFKISQGIFVNNIIRTIISHVL